MIVLWEIDLRHIKYDWPWWKPGLFIGAWAGGRTWRLWWWMFSVSYYPSPGIKEFFDHVPFACWAGSARERRTR